METCAILTLPGASGAMLNPRHKTPPSPLQFDVTVRVRISLNFTVHVVLSHLPVHIFRRYVGRLHHLKLSIALYTRTLHLVLLRNTNCDLAMNSDKHNNCLQACIAQQSPRLAFPLYPVRLPDSRSINLSMSTASSVLEESSDAEGNARL